MENTWGIHGEYMENILSYNNTLHEEYMENTLRIHYLIKTH
jgi:hypothetical protein